MNANGDLQCAYIVSRYPSVTHTFVLREILALRDRGVGVAPVTVRRPSKNGAIAEADRAEAANTHAILPVSPTELIRAHAGAFARSPRAYVQTLVEALRDAPLGVRSTAWQLFYFVEGIVFWRWLREQGLRHVHAHHANVGADLAMIATRFGNRSAGLPMFTWSMTVHGPTELADVGAHKLRTKVERANAVVATSDFVRAQLISLIESGGTAHVKTIYCGLPAGPFAAIQRSFDTDGPLRVLSVAQLAPRKGEDVLLDALARLRRDGHDLELTLVGDGPDREALERQATELGISDSVTFAGAVGRDEVESYYARADAFCLPSFAEGVPTVLMEAMASGLPVVATQVMGVPELVEDGCGILVPPGRADALADALARLADDADLRRSLGTSGRGRVLQDFALTDSAAAMEEVFRRVAVPSAG